jgi:hypothetical protein
MKQFPEAILDEVRRVFNDKPAVVYRSKDAASDTFPGYLPVRSVEFRPGSRRSVIEVRLGGSPDRPLLVVISASDYEPSYDVPHSGPLSSLAWVISIRAMEQVFSYARADLGDVVQLR